MLYNRRSFRWVSFEIRGLWIEIFKAFDHNSDLKVKPSQALDNELSSIH